MLQPRHLIPQRDNTPWESCFLEQEMSNTGLFQLFSSTV